MRLGQHVRWKSKQTADKIFTGTVVCFEQDKEGWALVRVDNMEPTLQLMPIRRNRLHVLSAPAKFNALGGGDSPNGSAALLSEVA